MFGQNSKNRKRNLTFVQNYFQRLEQALTERHLTKGALAAHLSCALSTISRWQHAAPRAETIQRTAYFLGVSAQWLMTGETAERLAGVSDRADLVDRVDGGPAKSDGKAKDFSGAGAGNLGAVGEPPTLLERVAVLEAEQARQRAEQARQREELAGVYELLAARVRGGPP